MSDSRMSLGETAKGLARNPLGIIALFIVMVYGFATLVTSFAASFTAAERMPLVYFLVGFPVLVLAVFSWLVSKHSGKLFAPSDFKNEDNYVRMQMTAAASLFVAASKREASVREPDLERIIQSVRSTSPSYLDERESWRRYVLWVDDHPDNNTYERKAFKAVGLRFAIAQSTEEALHRISKEDFTAVISDMERREGPREGYELLDRMRKAGDRTPLFFYTSSGAPEHKRETMEHGGQGCTNDPQELYEMVIGAVIERVKRARFDEG